MFNSARVKLTAWYLFIIMLISISFSIAIYNVLTSELDRVERLQRLRQERQIISRRQVIDPEVIEETKNRLKVVLLVINLGILGLAGLAGYFLAGITLKPIKEMIDDQNRFITDASHELRTPLTALKSEIEVNLRDKKLTLPAAKRLMKSNLEEVNNLQVLSDNLIRLTQYQKSNHDNFEEVNLLELSQEAVRRVEVLAKHKNILIKNKIGEIRISGDRQSLIELLVIFLDNAIKYSSENTKIIMTAEKIDHNIRINIQDEGIGISEDELPHLFDRFYRGDQSRTKAYTPGYGLGLSIAKQIIEKHKGSISVESRLDKGTTFTILL